VSAPPARHRGFSALLSLNRRPKPDGRVEGARPHACAPPRRRFGDARHDGVGLTYPGFWEQVTREAVRALEALGYRASIRRAKDLSSGCDSGDHPRSPSAVPPACRRMRSCVRFGRRSRTATTVGKPWPNPCYLQCYQTERTSANGRHLKPLEQDSAARADLVSSLSHPGGRRFEPG
jgi:hypothetical protein